MNTQASKEKKHRFDDIQAFLYSPAFIFTVVIAGTIPMIMHSHQLFYDVSPFKGNDLWKNTYAFFYALSFDLTILVFTIHVIKNKPIIYAGISFVMNILYFDPFNDISMGEYIRAFTKVFLAGVLAYTGFSYAELFVEKIKFNAPSTTKKDVYKTVNKKVNLKSKQNEYPCAKCGKVFSSIKALNGHMKVH